MKSPILFVLVAFTAITTIQAQTTPKKSVSFVLWDGMVVAGYVDEGGFLHFGGPTVKLVTESWSIGVGVLPSLRFKDDKNLIRNTFVTPALGAGLTFIYKHFVVQLPLYYNPKTAVDNGMWNVGFGIGYKF